MEFLLRGMRGIRRYFDVFNHASFQKLHIKKVEVKMKMDLKLLTTLIVKKQETLHSK
jgi:hypothetical protein